jgi:hypothetical protein
VELLVAATIVAVGLAGVVGLRAAAVRAERDAIAARRAAGIADDLLEGLAAAPAAELPALAGARDPVELGGVTFRPAVEVGPVADRPTLLRLRAEVRWGGDGLVALETLRSTRAGP